MSIRINSGSDSLKRTISCPAIGNNPFTVMVWVKLITNVSAYATIFEVGDTYPESAVLRTGIDGLNLNMFASGMNISGSVPLTLGAWAYVGITRASGGAYVLWKDGANIASFGDFGAVTGTTIQFGNNPFNEYIDAEFRGARAWSKALTEEEIALEMASDIVVETDSLFGDWDMEDDASAGVDRSINENHLIAVSISNGESEPSIYEDTMTTYYVNINESYSTVGDGSLENRFNFAQFHTFLGSNTASGNVCSLSGSRLFTVANSTAYQTSPGVFEMPIKSSVEIISTDINNPWSIGFATGLVVKIDPPTEDMDPESVILSDGRIISIGNLQIGNYNHNIELRNIYTKSLGQVIRGRETANFLGCWLNALSENEDDMGVSMAADGQILGENSVFVSKGTMYFGDDENVSAEFANSVFSIPELNVVSYATPTDLVFDTCQFEWVEPTVLPDYSSDRNAFVEQVLATDSGVNDITINASGTFTGYTKGLFGGPDRTNTHGIGAFYFGDVVIVEPPPEEPEDTIPKPAIENLPVRGLKLGRYVSSPMGGFRPSTEAPSIEQGYIPTPPSFVETIRHTSAGPEGGFKAGE
jgi:hypothetical protein